MSWCKGTAQEVSVRERVGGFGEQEQPYSEEKTFPVAAAGGVGLNLSCSLVHASVVVWMYDPGQGK